MKSNIFIEFNNQQFDYKKLEETAKNIWRSSGNKIKDIKDIKLYFKPLEQKCYYVLNDDFKGFFNVSL